MEQQVFIQILEVSGNGNHGCIVGRVAEFWNKDIPAILFGMFPERVTQSVVGRDSSCNGYFFNLVFFGSFPQFVHQDVYNSCFQRGGQIRLYDAR